MVTMKKLVPILLSLVLLLAGCGGSTSSGSGGDGQTYRLRLSTHYPEGHSALDSVYRIQEKLAEESGGALQLTIYPSSQLGDYTLAYEELMKGSIDFAFISMPSSFDQRLEMNYIPYMLRDYSEMADAYGKDSFFFQKFSEINEELGVKFLGVYGEGFMGFGLKSIPEDYTNPNVRKTPLIRTPNMESFVLPTEDMGYNTTTIPYADLYSAMQTGVCDGWIGGTPILNYTGFRDVIKYFIPYNCMVESTNYLMSKRIYDEMPPQYQQLIEEAFLEEAIRSYTESEALNNQALADLEAYGIEILPISDVEINALAEHVRAVTWPKLDDKIGKDIMDGLKAELKS